MPTGPSFQGDSLIDISSSQVILMLFKLMVKTKEYIPTPNTFYISILPSCLGNLLKGPYQPITPCKGSVNKYVSSLNNIYFVFNSFMSN